MFEDGYASYSMYYGSFFETLSSKYTPWVKRKFHEIVDSVFFDIDMMYVFSPEAISYKPKFMIQKLQTIDYTDAELIGLYNMVFNYNQNVDSYDQQVIFFEESYYADGYKTNDVDIVNMIAEIVGRENVFVKIHPRNPVNRFKELGYKTNVNTSIPWEVIALNIDLNNKILVTIASVAAIVPCTMLGKKYTGVLLMNMLDDDSFLKKNIINLYESICSNYDQLHLVRNQDDVISILGSKGG